MSIDKVKGWLKGAKRGSKLVYHIGDLQFDRQNGLRTDYRQIDGIANMMYAGYMAGKLTLVQKKIFSEAHTYSYVAVML